MKHLRLTILTVSLLAALSLSAAPSDLASVDINKILNGYWKTKQASAAATDALMNQIKLLVPDADEIARRKELAADVAEIKRELAQIKAQLAPPAPANK